MIPTAYDKIFFVKKGLLFMQILIFKKMWLILFMLYSGNFYIIVNHMCKPTSKYSPDQKAFVMFTYLPLVQGVSPESHYFGLYDWLSTNILC